MIHPKINPIAKQNDMFRIFVTSTTIILGAQSDGGTYKGAFVTTATVAALSETERDELYHAVWNFTEFTEDNDPHGEHDFGAINMHGQKWFWKIDYYADDTCEWGSENHADTAQTYRVLTLMNAREY